MSQGLLDQLVISTTDGISPCHAASVVLQALLFLLTHSFSMLCYLPMQNYVTSLHMLQRQHAADSLPLLLSLTLRNCVSFVQDDEKRSEAISMLEESSQAGCLQSSYLMWQHSRKAAVSQVLSLPCFEIYSQKHAPLVKTAVCLGFISYLHSQSNITS